MCDWLCRAGSDGAARARDVLVHTLTRTARSDGRTVMVQPGPRVQHFIMAGIHVRAGQAGPRPWPAVAGSACANVRCPPGSGTNPPGQVRDRVTANVMT